MSPRNWGHGQTFTGGAIAGLALAQKPLLIFAGGVAVGVALVLLARFGRRLGAFVVELVRQRHIRTVDGRARVTRVEPDPLGREDRYGRA